MDQLLQQGRAQGVSKADFTWREPLFATVLKKPILLCS